MLFRSEGQGKGNPLLAALDETSFSLHRRTTSGSSLLWLHLQSHELDDKERHRIGNMGKFSHHHPLHCLQDLFVLLTSELGKEETQIGKVKEERKTPLFKVLSYLDNTSHASLLLTPDRCHINPKKRTIE